MLEDPRRSFDALTRWEALEEAASRGELAAHRRKLLARARELPPGSEFAVALTGLTEALQIDLAFLRSHPEALFSALVWRCSHHEGPASGALDPLGPLIPRESGLAELARRWREERTRTRLDGVWVRALGPPLHGPGGPLIAELRTAGPHSLRLARTAEGHVLLYPHERLRPEDGKAQRPIHSWHVEEGTLVDGPDIVPAVPPLKVVTRGWGQSAVLLDSATGAQCCELPIPEEGSASGGSISPDGTLCTLVGSGDEYAFGFVRLFECATGRLLREWKSREVFWKAPVFSPDGRSLMTPNAEGLFLLDLETGREECLPALNAKDAVFSSDGRTVVTTDGDVASVWDLERLRALGRRSPQPSLPMRFSPDGRRLFAGDWLCDGATGHRIRKIGLHRGRYLAGGPPRDSFICGTARIVSVEGGVHVWDTETGEERAFWKHYYAHWHRVAFSPDGLCYAVARERVPQFEIMDVDTGTVRVRILPGEGGPTCMTFSPDGQWLASGTPKGGIDLWNTVNGQRLGSLRGHAAPVNAVVFSRDGHRLVSAGYDEELRLWELPSGTLLASRPLTDRDGIDSYHERGTARTHRTWLPTPAALRALSGWEGFEALPPSPYVAEVQGGVTLFTDTRTGRPVVAFPLEGRWIMHPNGVTWAAPSAHVVLEGRPDGR